jgi:hypothetical protein
MQFTVYTDEPIKFKISCDSAATFSVTESVPVSVIVSVIRDGKDGIDGDDGYTPVKGIDYFDGEKGDPGTNAFEAIEDDVDFDGHTIINMRNATASQEPATLVQLNTALAEAKAYADTVSADTVRSAGFWDASTGVYPTGTIRRGDQYEVSVEGNGFDVGDLIRARINSPGQIPSNWSESQGNLRQSLENRQGTAKIITDTNAADENSTNDTDILTAKKWWQNTWSRVRALSWTWAARQTFTTAPRLSSATANHYLKVNATKDVESVSSIPAADVTETSTKSFSSATEKANWNNKIGPNDIYFTEDFLAQTSSYPTLVTHPAFKLAQNSSGTVVNTTINPPIYDAKNQGVLYMRPLGSANYYVGISSDDKIKIGSGTGDLVLQEFILIEDITSGLSFSKLFGLISAVGSSPQPNGIFFALEYGTVGGINSSPSSNWKCIVVNAGTPQIVDTAINATTTAWVKLKIVINASGTSADFFINNAPVATLGSLPQVRMQYSTLFCNRSAGVRGYWSDFIDFWYKGVR